MEAIPAGMPGMVFLYTGGSCTAMIVGVLGLMEFIIESNGILDFWVLICMICMATSVVVDLGGFGSLSIICIVDISEKYFLIGWAFWIRRRVVSSSSSAYTIAALGVGVFVRA